MRNIGYSTSTNVALINGRITVISPSIYADSNIILTVRKAIGTQGILSLDNQIDGSVDIVSTSSDDQSEINIMIW